MTDAAQAQQLPPEAIAFIKDVPQPKMLQTAAVSTAAAKDLVSTSKAAPDARPVSKAATTKAASSPAMVALGFHVPAEISAALLRAASERKLSRTEPYTQKAIIADALAAWLQKHGYLAK